MLWWSPWKGGKDGGGVGVRERPRRLPPQVQGQAGKKEGGPKTRERKEETRPNKVERRVTPPSSTEESTKVGKEEECEEETVPSTDDTASRALLRSKRQTPIDTVPSTPTGKGKKNGGQGGNGGKKMARTHRQKNKRWLRT